MTAQAFIALLPFDILTLAEDRVEPQRAWIAGRSVVFYWPFWTEGESGRILAPVRSASIPSRSNLPFYTVPPLEMRIELRPPPGRAFANALRIDLEGQPDEDVATDAANGLLRQLRVRSCQWWIGHAHREGEGLIRAAYNIDASGALLGRDCIAGARVESRLRIERPVTREHFIEACRGVASGQLIPPYWELFFDAVYFSIHRDDWRRALLEACIACELAITYEAMRAAAETQTPPTAVRRALSDRDLLRNLRKGLPTLFGQQADLRHTSPVDYELIRQLWMARGAIAHGRVGAANRFGETPLPSRTQAADLLQAVIRLLNWLTELPTGGPTRAA